MLVWHVVQCDLLSIECTTELNTLNTEHYIRWEEKGCGEAEAIVDERFLIVDRCERRLDMSDGLI